MELGAALFLGFRRHPGQVAHVLVQRGFNGFHDLQNTLFAFRRKCARNIGLAQSFTQRAISRVYAAAPARSQLRRTGKSVAEEIEILTDESFAQERRGFMRQPAI